MRRKTTSAALDLHLHTTASDGSLTPTQLVREAAAAGVRVIAITDHDTTEAVADAMEAGRAAGVTVVPGVELSADTDNFDIHLLGYFLHAEEAEFQHTLQQLRVRRATRNARMLAKLEELHLPVDAKRVEEIGGHGSVGRPHIAEAMVERGYVASQGEAFYKYLGRGKPAFVPRGRLTIPEAVRIITRAGGVSVLAHPAKIGSWEMVEKILADDVAGVEVYHSDHTAAETARLLALAKARNLLVTGGTDSHGPRSDRPSMIGSVTMPQWVEEEFLARAPEWWKG